MRVPWVLLVLFRTAARGLRASAVTSAAAIGTIAISLLLLGVFALLVGNMQGLLSRFGEQIQVVAYLTPETDDAEARDLAGRVATVEGVQSVSWVSREQALERFQRSLGGVDLLEGLDENPLPASLEVTLLPGHRTPEGLAIVVAALDGLPGIEDLAHGQEWVTGYSRALSLVRSVAFVLGGVLVLAALLIVGNTIRLAVYAREDELEILALVGASRTFVRVPFLLEGVLQGTAGGILAVGLLYVGFRIWVPGLQYGLELFIGHGAPQFFTAGQALALVIGGAVLGTLGSLVAVVGWRA